MKVTVPRQEGVQLQGSYPPLWLLQRLQRLAFPAYPGPKFPYFRPILKKTNMIERVYLLLQLKTTSSLNVCYPHNGAVISMTDGKSLVHVDISQSA